MNRLLKMGILGAIFLLLSTSGAQGAADIPALRDAPNAAERTRIQALIESARAEGKLTIDATYAEPGMGKYILAGFRAYYGLSDLAEEFTYAATAQIIARVNQVLQAGRTPPDIVWNASWGWYLDLLARGKIMRYNSPMYKDYTISHSVGNSMPDYWVSDSYSFHPMWNPSALAKVGIKDFNPTSWWDFTDPKLSKVTCIGNIAKSASQASIAIGLRKTLGEEWYRKMAALRPAVFTRPAQGRDWCASGEYPITLTCSAKHAETVKQMGADVKLLYPKEGIIFLPLAPIIMSSTPHPNAAKLFIDYIRSIPGTSRMAESRICLLYGRPGVKNPYKEFLPNAEDIKAIPMNWSVEDTTQAVRQIQQWAVSIGLAY